MKRINGILSLIALSMVCFLGAPQSAMAATGVNVTSRTQAQIKSYIESKGALLSDSVSYSVNPSLSQPYAAGQLSNATQQSALAMVNQMRYIAGLPEVALDTEHQAITQAGALVNEVNGNLSHYPSQPAGMDGTLYDLGYTGASKSNLAMGNENLNMAIVQGWMSDHIGQSNLDAVGHRRWILNPKMGKACFGAVGRTYSMYAIDMTGSSSATGVIWPAQQMPVEYFGNYYPWSYSYGSSVDASKVNVKLVKRGTSLTWNFNSQSSDGHFAVNNGGYGLSGCIIFMPDEVSIDVGDIFDVTITGLPIAVSYSVEFFSIGRAGMKYPEMMYRGFSRNATLVKGGALCYEFTPSTDGTYSFFTEGDVDTKGYLYNSMAMKDANQISFDDNSGSGNNFLITENLREGQKVYLVVEGVGQSGGTVGVWCSTLFDVIYNANGGTGAPEKQVKMYGRSLTLSSTIPTKSCELTFNANGGTVGTTNKTLNSTFYAWNTSAEGTGAYFMAGTTVYFNDSYTLYAKWNDAPAGELPTPTRTGYTFRGWWTDLTGGTRVIDSTQIPMSMTLYARWSENGAVPGLMIGGEEEESLTAGERIKYSFTAPYSGFFTFETKGSTDTYGELYKDYDCSERLTYDDDSGENRNFRISQVMSAGETVWIIVKGFSTSTTGDYRIVVNENYMVTYNANGGTNAPAGQIKPKGETINLSTNAPSRTSYVYYYGNGGTVDTDCHDVEYPFQKWCVSTNGTGTSYQPGDVYSADASCTLYAIWEKKYMGDLPQNIPVRSGYVFDGWYTSATGGTKVTATTEITQDISVYAHWKTALQITKQPVNISAATGDTVSLSISATGATAYKWQYSADGGNTWNNCSGTGYNTNRLSFTMKESYAGRKYRCRVSNANTTINSSVASLSLKINKPVITKQPQAVTAAVDETVKFTVMATGADSYQWQYSTDGGTVWGDCAGTGNKTATLTFAMKDSYAGRKYRCVLSNAGGSTISAAVNLNLKQSKPVITTQPGNISAAAGETVTMKIVATEAATYQWQYSTDNGSTWNNCTGTGYNTNKLTFTMKDSYVGRKYRCKVGNAGGTVTSNVATLSLKIAKPTITLQPANVSATAGETVTMKIVASGANGYQWQYSTDGGSSWNNCTGTGYNTNKLSFTMKDSYAGRKYRCKVSNAGGTVTSNTANLSVKAEPTKPSITTQPQNKSAIVGDTVTMKVVATGATAYQWQFSTDGGVVWADCTGTGNATASLSFMMKESYAGRKYRCLVSNALGVSISNVATLSVKATKPVIKSQPQAVSAATGATVQFTITATGATTYQWQYSTDGGTVWGDCKGIGNNTATLTFAMKDSYNGRKYRCVMTNAEGVTISNTVNLTLK